MDRPVRVGAVLYAPKVSVIWDIIRDYFEDNDCQVDVVLFKDYSLQAAALVNGDIDIAWNSPLAWLDCQRQSGGACRAIAMRDTDRDRMTHIVVRKGEVGDLRDLRGKVVAVGASDSPQARLIPLLHIERAGLRPGTDFRVLPYEVGVGLHGDHVGGEADAAEALKSGDAAAAVMLDLNWQRWTSDGTLSPASFDILSTVGPFDHCVFTTGPGFSPEAERRWLETLFSMSYDNPQHREMMDLEGLKQWLPGRTSGFNLLSDAVATLRFFD